MGILRDVDVVEEDSQKYLTMSLDGIRVYYAHEASQYHAYYDGDNAQIMEHHAKFVEGFSLYIQPDISNDNRQVAKIRGDGYFGPEYEIR